MIGKTKIVLFLLFFGFLGSFAMAKPKKSTIMTKFYNFDDLLINGEYKKPQILYTDSRQKVKFERLLKLKKDFLLKLRNTDKDPALK